MEPKREQTPQTPGKKGDQPRHEPPRNPSQPQRGGPPERPRQQPDPTRQHQSGGSAIDDEYEFDTDDAEEAGEEHPGGHKDF